jgi:acyl carrier protein phosphodiesterase
MNYLAHAYLSFGNPGLLVGNMISDHVKGRRQYDYPEDIRKGIILHRSIDNFTDVHVVVEHAKALFRPHYRLYASPIIDILFDHFLAIDAFTDSELLSFSRSVYQVLDEYFPLLPERFQKLLPYMKEHNWLYHYRERWGIERSLKGLVHRASYLSESETAFLLFQEHFPQLQAYFGAFFPDLKNFAKHEAEGLLL